MNKFRSDPLFIEAIKNASKKVPKLSKRLAPIYKKDKWEWYDGIPNEQRIAGELTRLLERLRTDIYNKEHTISTGGLYVTAYKEGRRPKHYWHISMGMQISEQVWAAWDD